MNATVSIDQKLISQLVTGVLGIKPLANFAKQKAREMIIKRGKSIGVDWVKEVQALCSRGGTEDFSPEWEAELATVQNLAINYPEYYLKPFHAYDQGNLSWQAATEVEVAAYTVHSQIWPNNNNQGDAKLRQTYHDILTEKITTAPQDILDIACGVGMSTFALQEVYPQAKLTGLDLSPYFLTVARYRSRQRQASINWIHAAAEATGLADASFDLVSIFLLFHELPQSAAREILREIRRIVRPGGHFTFMDMNPQSPIYAQMPAYILTLLKSTEPYMDEYFTFDMEQELLAAGFSRVSITANSPRHRTVIAKVSD